MEKAEINLSNIDITETPMFEKYADSKEQLNRELQNRLFPSAWRSEQARNQNEQLKTLVHSLPKETLRQKADSLIEIQGLREKHIDLINYMADKKAYTYSQFDSLWSPILWQSHENAQSQKMNVNGTTIDSFDLDYMIAENLQQLYASEDPQSEYFEWIQQQHKIEVEINTDGTTEDEVVARNTFIKFLNSRESEIRRIITLYSGAAFNSNSALKTPAQEKLKFLTFKLSELRRLRERTSNLKSQADQKEAMESKQKGNARQIALASDFILTTSSFLGSRAGTDKALSQRLFNQIQSKDKETLKQQIQKRKKHRRLWKNLIKKLRGIAVQNDDDDDIEQEMLSHQKLQRRHGFSSEQYLIQRQLSDINSRPD